MPTINLNRDGAMLRLQELPGALAGIGIAVPENVKTILDRSGWAGLPDPADAVEEAKRKLADASTEKEWLAAQRELIDSLAFGVAHAECQDYIMAVRTSKLNTAWRDASGELVEQVCARYNEHAGPFAAAAGALPNLADPRFSVFDLTPTDSQHLHEAKDHADELSRAFSVYKQVADLAGLHTKYDQDAATAARLGDYESHQALADAAHMIFRYRTKGHTTPDGKAPMVPTLTRLAPHIAVVFAGGSLRLKHPAVADAILSGEVA